jgi:glycosyltransferase involved in cell wall biosynthesis
VHGQGTGGSGDIAIRLGYPSLVTIHGVGIFEAQLRERNNRFLGPIRVQLAKRMTEGVLRKADLVVSLSTFDKEYLSSLRTENIVSISNAVRKGFFEARPRLENTKRIMFTGLVIVRKNVAGIVRAFKKVKEKVPDAVLDIVGPTPDKAYLKEVLDNIDPPLKESIVFHGGVNGTALVELMNSAAVAVMFSIYENLPCTVAEFLTLGKPVVSSKVGGLQEMITDGYNGLLVESGDEQALADRLIRLLNDDTLRAEMGRRGREIAFERWRPERVAEATIRAYQRAVAMGRQR